MSYSAIAARWARFGFAIVLAPEDARDRRRQRADVADLHQEAVLAVFDHVGDAGRARAHGHLLTDQRLDQDQRQPLEQRRHGQGIHRRVEVPMSGRKPTNETPPRAPARAASRSRRPFSCPSPTTSRRRLGISVTRVAAASNRKWCPFCGESRPTIPTTKSPGGSASATRASSRDGRWANRLNRCRCGPPPASPGGCARAATKSRTASDTAITSPSGARSRR